MKPAALFCLAFVLVTGCVKAKAIELAPSQRLDFPALADWRDVELYDTEADVPGPYVKVARLQSKGQYNWGGVPKHVRKMQKKAARMGANAVIVSPEFKDPSTGAKIANAFFFTGANRKGRGLAIRILRSAEEQARAEALGVAVYRKGELLKSLEEGGPAESPGNPPPSEFDTAEMAAA